MGRKKDRRKERRKYPQDFKQEAVQLSNKIGAVEAGEQLDVPLSTLQRWRTQKSKLPVEKSQDVLRLQLEVKKLKKELTK